MWTVPMAAIATIMMDTSIRTAARVMVTRADMTRAPARIIVTRADMTRVTAKVMVTRVDVDTAKAMAVREDMEMAPGIMEAVDIIKNVKKA